MSKITLAPNASGTGTLTVAAPNTNTDRTLTLPDVTTTLVGTDATQTLTNKSIAASQLTGALPAIDGSALTGIVTGGMTLLGTLTTTSGTSATLSGLTLTSYKLLYVAFNGPSTSSFTNAALFLSGTFQICPVNSALSDGIYGYAIFDLITGKYTSTTAASSAGAGTTTSYWGNGSITTASTSISFSFTGSGTFDAGSIDPPIHPRRDRHGTGCCTSCYLIGPYH